jgi:hypothetical protein
MNGGSFGIRSAERSDDGARYDVGEMQRYQAGRHRLLRPLADAAQVVRARQPHHAHAVLLRARDTDLHRLQAYHLAVARLAIERNHGAAVEHDLRMLVDDQSALEQRIDIARDHAHAVGVVPREIGGNEVRGDELRLARVAAAGADDRCYRFFQGIFLK